MISLASPQHSRGVKICFVSLELKCGRTDTSCENSDHYRLTWRCEYNARANVIKMVDALQVTDVLKDERIVDCDLTTNLFIHGIHEGLVNGHALFSQGGRVVNGNFVQFRMRGPVLIQYQQEFLKNDNLYLKVILYI